MTRGARVRLAQDALLALAAADPVEASAKGLARHRAALPRYGRTERDETIRRLSALRRGVAEQTARGAAARERDLVAALLDAALVRLEVLEVWRRNAVHYVDRAFEGLFGLTLDPELGRAERGRALRARLHEVPRFFAEAEVNLDAPDRATVELAIESIEQSADFLRTELPRAFPETADAARAAARAADRLHSYLARIAAHAPPAQGIGEEAYRAVLRRVHRIDADPRALARRAREAVDRLRSRLAGLPRLDGAPAPSGAAEPEAVLAYHRKEIERLRAFCRRCGAFSVPGRAPVRVRRTPPFLAGLSPGLSYNAPPPFGRSRRGHLFITLRDRPTAGERAFFARRVATGMSLPLIAHEVFPGHHLQALHANAHPSPLVRFASDDFFQEGWAHYVEEACAALGLYDEVPLARTWLATGLRFRAARVVLDVGLHVDGWTERQAEAWAVRADLGRPQAQIRSEIRRYLADPVQAASYFAGKERIEAMLDTERARRGRRFDLRRFHDRLLAQGSVPLAIAAAGLGED